MTYIEHEVITELWNAMSDKTWSGLTDAVNLRLNIAGDKDQASLHQVLRAINRNLGTQFPSGPEVLHDIIMRDS